MAACKILLVFVQKIYYVLKNDIAGRSI